MSDTDEIIVRDDSAELPAPKLPAGAPGDGLRAELGQLVEEYLRLMAVPESDRGDEFARAERDCRESLNREYWQRLFGRLGQVVNSSPPDELTFGDGDDRLFDFGWIDERLFPAAGLAYDRDFADETYEVRDLRAHLAGEDSAFLLVPQRRKLAEAVAGMRRRIEEFGRDIAAATAERSISEARLPAADRARLADLDRLIDAAAVGLIGMEATKRSKGLAGDKMREYARVRTAFTDQNGKRDAILKRLGPPGEAVAACNKRIHDAKVAAVDALQKIETLNAALAKQEEAASERRARRRAELEERLGEIREDVTMCGRWGRTTASPVLLRARELNAKSAVVEAIRRVEDFDPGIFANRKCEREGRPVVVLTPGIGNGSYDFRSNILIIPRTSPRSTLESVAFALALYRRDVDKSVNEGVLWKSFLEDIAWAKLGGVPRSVQAQMRTFVRAYTVWATREAIGQPVLQPEFREWFARKIAPSIQQPMMPRSLRGIPASRRDALLAELPAGEDAPAPGRAGAEELHRRGCLHWMKDDFARALAAFERARALDPACAPAAWAAASCHRLPPETFASDLGSAERLRRARQALGAFISSAEQSWWTRQAQSLASELEAKLKELERSGPGA